MTIASQKFLRLLQHPVAFRFFLLFKLPSAFFSGVRIKTINENRSEITVPYKWFSKNPFRSTYFACLAMAAEMSTGLLAMINTYNNKPAVSMLVTGLEAAYSKKATGITTFICEEGKAITETIASAVNSGEAKILRVKSVGKNVQGDIIAEFFIQWSFKVKP